MEGVMETEAVEGLARAIGGDMDIDEKDEWWTTPRGLAQAVFNRLAADPAAARAIRDAIDPDGLRAGMVSALDWLDHDDPYAAAHGIRVLIEGTPDAD